MKKPSFENLDKEEEHLLAYWTRGEKNRTLNVVKEFEERNIIYKAIKQLIKITISILGVLLTSKYLGLGMYWSNLVTWMAQK